MSFASVSYAEPFVPDHDDLILERVPAAAHQREFRALRRELAANPVDEHAALKLARAYLEVGRVESDPRFISYAQAVLARFIARPTASVDVLTLAATALQSSHRFDEALAMLDRALDIEPRHPQALLTKATVLQVRGDFAAARRTCAKLFAASDQLVAATCMASVDAMNGRLEASYALLQRIAVDHRAASVTTRSWLLGQLGEMAMRLGRDDDAERHFKAALAANPLDNYVKGEYADLLLRQRRHAEVIELLQEHEAQDALLLRLALVEHLAPFSPRRWRNKYAALDAAARRTGDTTHLRERARYQLDIDSNAVEALALARDNWTSQREPADIRIFVRAARAANDATAIHEINDWIAATGYQDSTLVAPISHRAGTP